MNFAAALKSDIGKYLEGLKPWLAVTLFLLHERNKGAASKWAPYVSLLPSALGLPMFWYVYKSGPELKLFQSQVQYVFDHLPENKIRDGCHILCHIL